MAGGGGFMHEAGKRLQQNREMLKRNSLFNNSDKSISPKGEIKNGETKPLSKEQQEYVQQLIIKRKQEEKIRFIKRITIAIVGGVTIALIIWTWMKA